MRKCLGRKDVLRSNRIVDYFIKNPKNHPAILTIASLQSFFTQLLKYHGLKDKSKANVARSLGVNIYFVDDYATAAHHYPMRKVSQIIGFLREADLQLKGVDAQNLDLKGILQTLIFKILH